MSRLPRLDSEYYTIFTPRLARGVNEKNKKDADPDYGGVGYIQLVSAVLSLAQWQTLPMLGGFGIVVSHGTRKCRHLPNPIFD